MVRDFKESDKGVYTCSKKSAVPAAPNPTPAKIDLIMRPRLLADFNSLSRTETDEVVMTGHRVSVPLEGGLEGRLVCRTNPHFSGPIRVTWFYHGRQLIGPAASMLEDADIVTSAESNKEKKKLREGRKQPTSNENSAELGDVKGNTMQKFLNAVFRPAVVDPAELGVSLENNSQVRASF